VTIPFLENAAAMCSNPFGPWTRRELLRTVPYAVSRYSDTLLAICDFRKAIGQCNRCVF